MNYLPIVDLVNFQWGLGNSVDVFVESLCELITVVNEALPSEDDDCAANHEVLRIVKLLLFQTHSWIMGMDRDLWELLSSKQQWEWISSIVLPSDLLHFDTVIGQEIVDSKKIGSTFQSVVFPQGIKG